MGLSRSPPRPPKGDQSFYSLCFRSFASSRWKQMLSRFAPHGQASCAIGPRMQSALHGFADAHVFIIHPLADRDTLAIALGRGLAHVVEVEIEDDLAAIDSVGQHQVGVHVARRRG